MGINASFVTAEFRQHLPAKSAQLSREEEAELIESWQQHGDRSALDKINRAFQPFLAKLARTFLRDGLQLEDLVQAANIGFMQGINGFKLETGFRLATFSKFWVRAALQDHVSLMQPSVRITNGRNQRRVLFGITKARTRIERTGETATDAKLAKILMVGEDEISAVRMAMSGASSLDTPINVDEGDGSTLGAILANDDEPIDERYAREQHSSIRRKGIAEAVAALDDRSRQIFTGRRLRDEPETLEELSQRFNISRERIRQIELKAFDKVAAHMRAHDTIGLEAA